MDPLNQADVPRPAYEQTQGEVLGTMADQRRTYLGPVTPLSSTALEFRKQRGSYRLNLPAGQDGCQDKSARLRGRGYNPIDGW